MIHAKLVQITGCAQTDLLDLHKNHWSGFQKKLFTTENKKGLSDFLK